MPRKAQYLEDIMGREFYDFYRKSRRKPSKIIDQYNYFEKAINGMIWEFRQMMRETEYGIHLKGLGVMYKKPFGELMQKLTIFTHKRITKKLIHFYIEDDYLRREYLIANAPSLAGHLKDNTKDKATAIILHRKLKLKK